MGCLKSMLTQIGCAVVLVALLVVGWMFRDQLGAVWRKVRNAPPPAVTETYTGVDSAARPAATLERLGRRSGPAYVDLTAGEVAALVSEQLGPGRRVVDSVRVAFVENEVRVRASADLSQLPRGALGPFGGAMEGRQPVMFGGTFVADSAGRLLLTVSQLSVGDFPFPRGTIGAVLKALRVPGVAGRTVPIPMEQRVGDVRIMDDKLRLYRYSP